MQLLMLEMADVPPTISTRSGNNSVACDSSQSSLTGSTSRGGVTPSPSSLPFQQPFHQYNASRENYLSPKTEGQLLVPGPKNAAFVQDLGVVASPIGNVPNVTNDSSRTGASDSRTSSSSSSLSSGTIPSTRNETGYKPPLSSDIMRKGQLKNANAELESGNGGGGLTKETTCPVEEMVILGLPGETNNRGGQPDVTPPLNVTGNETPDETSCIVPLVRMERSANKDVEKGGCESEVDVEKSTSLTEVIDQDIDVSDVCVFKVVAFREC